MPPLVGFAAGNWNTARSARPLIIRLAGVDTVQEVRMQITIRSLAVAVATLSLAGSALAASSKAPSPSTTVQATAQPTNASSSKPTKSKTQTTLVATGKIVQFDATGQALTIATSKGEQHFTVGPDVRLRDSSHTISADELGKMAGHKATVRYKESAGTKNVESIQVSSATPKASTKG
jgi:hypothetical protein